MARLISLKNLLKKLDVIICMFTVLMLHHPMSEIIDGKKIGEDIDGRFKLQFYGHVHKQSSSSDGAIKIYSGALQPEEDNNDE